MPPHQGRQAGDLLGAFLQQQQVGTMGLDQPGDVFRAGADPAQQIPADDPQPAFMTMIRMTVPSWLNW